MGQKERWAKISKEERSRLQSERARKGWAKKTAKERRVHSQMMVIAKRTKWKEID